MIGYSLGLYEKAMPAGLSFSDMFKITKECGFDRLEISIDETDWRQDRLNWSRDKIIALGTDSRSYGTPIRTMCLSGHRKWPLGSHHEDTRKQAMRIMQKAIEFCSYAGISIIQLAGYDVYYEKSDSDTKKWFLENLAASVEYASEFGIVLAFETMETPFMDTVSKSMNYVREINSPWLGVYPDIGNLKNAAVLYGNDVIDDLMLGKGHIFAMHLKETAPGIYRDMTFGSGGHTEYQRCLQAAFELGVHMFTGEFWYHDGQNYMESIKNANRFLRDQIDRAIPESR